MGCWSAENATKAYLRTMKMGENAKEPNGAEFISAIAAGNNVKLIVVACAGIADSTTLALAAAAQQTGGRIVCILPGQEELCFSEMAIGKNAGHLEFVTGDVLKLLAGDYREADFVAIDCNLDNHDIVLAAVQECTRYRNAIVLGYNAFCKDAWRSSCANTQLLPIGEGLLLTKRLSRPKRSIESQSQKRGRWIFTVDKCTGEEHVFKVRSTPRGAIQA